MGFTNKHLDKKYPIKEWIRIYNDGSATDAVRNGGGGVFATLPDRNTLERSFVWGMRCTNHKAETEAIKEAIKMVNNKLSKTSKVVILSDARFGDSWRDKWLNKHFNQDCYNIEVKDVSSTQLRSFTRQLYTVSDAALLVDELLPFFPRSNNTQNTPFDETIETTELFPNLSTPAEPGYRFLREYNIPQDESGFHLDNRNGLNTMKNGDIQAENMTFQNNSDESATVIETSSKNQSSSEFDLKSDFVAGDETGISLGANTSSHSNSVCEDNDSLPSVSCDSYNAHTSQIEVRSTLLPSEALEPARLIPPVKITHDTCSSLGKDLLQMYLSQENCDCCIVVNGQKFPAHKCILSARSEYFEAMLGGHWKESQLDVVTLEGVSPQAVKHLLLFLYGGILALPTEDVSANLLDLFLVADMYGVSSLNKVLMFYLRRDLCHFFHKPCPVCIISAADALSLCHNFNLEDLKQRCLRWIGKNFTKIWPSKTFAGLPDSLQQLSLRSITGQFTTVNVLDIIVECNRLTSSLPRVKWTEAVLCLLTQFMDAAIEFTSSNFVRVIKMPDFLKWAKGATWKASALKDIFTSVIDSLPIDKACHVFQALLQLQATVSVTYGPGEEEASVGIHVEDEVTGLLEVMVQRCERFLRMHIHKVMRSSQWSELPKPVQTRIMETSAYLSLADLPEPKPRAGTRKPVSVRHVPPSRPTPGSEINRPRARGTTHGVPSAGLVVRTIAPRGAVASNPLGQNPGMRNYRTSQASGLGQQRTQSSHGRYTKSKNGGHLSNAGAKPKSNTSRQAFDLHQREEHNRLSSCNNSDGTPQTKCGNDGQSPGELNVKDDTEGKSNNLNRDSEDITGSFACSDDNQVAICYEKICSKESESTWPKTETNENSLSLPGSLSGFNNGCIVEDISDDTESNAGLISAVSTNGPDHSSLSHDDNYFSFQQSSGAECSEVSDQSRHFTSEQCEKTSSWGVLDTASRRQEKSPSQECSPRLRMSRLPAAVGSSVSRSPKQRWSAGSTDSVDSHHEAGDVQVGAVSQLEVSRNVSLPAQEVSGSGLAFTNRKDQIQPGEVKIVKMSRPLSVGFLVPPN
ncbi:BTB/POZ domain-containing protein 8 [Elysia marginata]|uniref:BTB/POZ domain-containing protein 8 n=1 Tax=Elysia marginata TaxID=1093978 RepID=A0AAV4HW35_9GAST|nr:BTB/POZ domain-containing protein 8 [Elysia marginata]